MEFSMMFLPFNNPIKTLGTQSIVYFFPAPKFETRNPGQQRPRQITIMRTLHKNLTITHPYSS